MKEIIIPARIKIVFMILVTSCLSAMAQNHWIPNSNPYEDYMTITGYIIKDGLEIDSDRFEIACFIEQECRASYRLQNINYLGHSYPCFLSIWGSAADNGKTVTLYLYDHETKKEFDINETVIYQYGESIGQEEPSRFTITSTLAYSIEILQTNNGKIESDRYSSLQGETVKLTATANQGYELENISVYKKGEPATTISLQKSDNIYTLIMPAYDILVSATFKKTQATLDGESIDKAKLLLQDVSYSLSQEEGNTEEAIKAWLVGKINPLIAETGISITSADITISSFTAAIAGDENNLSGTSGSYSFTITLTKGEVSDTLSKTNNLIVATGAIPFDIHIAPSENGSLTSDKTRAPEGSIITLTIVPAQGYELEAISARKYNDSQVNVLVQGTNNTHTIIMPAYDILVSATFKKTQATLNQESIDKAKLLLQDVSYSLSQQEGNTEEAIKTWLVGKINPLIAETGISITIADIAISSFTAAIAGDENNLSGTSGSYSFTITLTKGEVSDTLSKTNNLIVATGAIPFDIHIAPSENGSLTSDKTRAPEGSIITLTIVPDQGYELENISVYKKGEPTTTISLQKSDNIYTLIMPAYDILVSATFKKTQATLDGESIDKAKLLLQDVSYSLSQQEGNTEEAIKTWLVGKINPLIAETGISITIADIAISSFTAAIAGDENNLSGTSGSYSFTITLTKGEISDTINSLSGTITAMTYETNIEDIDSYAWKIISETNGLRISNLVCGKELSVFNLRGQLIWQNQVVNNEQFIILNQPDVYIIIHAGKQMKILYH